MPNEVMKSLTIGANTYDLPQKTSDLTNDSGFLTSYTETDPTVPSWAKQSTKPTYTANEVGAAASSHTHGNITNSGDITANATIANGDRLVINDESASKITNSSITFGSSTTQYLANNGTWQNIPTVPTKTSDLTNDSGFITSESDPIFTASAAHGITSTDITNWNNKISEPASEGTNGQVLMTNGSGTRTWGSVSTADEKVKLTSQSTSGNYPLIFGPTSITSNSTYQGYYNTGVTVNPNTKAVTATTFVGALTGTASGNLTSSSTLDASKLSGAIPSAVTATTQTSTDNSTKIATTAFVKTAIDNLPEPMVFKGSLGTGGTITSLPTASTSNTGYTYKVITAGTYASQSAKIGDTFISDGSAWILIPSGDEPSGTVTSITLKATSPISIDSNSAITTSGTRTLSHADSGVTAGTYKSVTVDSKGHVTAGSNPSETDPVFTGSAAYGISSSDITNWNGKTSNTGTVTSIRVQATSPVTSSVNTAQSNTLDTTIALADGYGDTKNPYTSKTKNYVLAAPSNANGTPSFRALVADDIPSLTKSKISDFPTIHTYSAGNDIDITNDTIGFDGYDVTTTTTTLCNETVTTIANGGSAIGNLVYSDIIDADPIKVTFNGVEHIFPRMDGEYGSYYYGAARPGSFDFSEYPFGLQSDGFEGHNSLITKNAGTYTVKIETITDNIMVSSDFAAARGYSIIENPSQVLVNESTTTTAESGSTLGHGTLSYFSYLNDVIKVTFNNVEYICSRDNQYRSYGAQYDSSLGDLDFSTYPFRLNPVSYDDNNFTDIVTQTAGTYTVKIENFPTVVALTDDFKQAIKSSFPGDVMIKGRDYVTAGQTTGRLGFRATAEGQNTTASDSASHAEGYGTIASNSNSHAEGNFTTASGSSSHAEGSNTVASGQTSHAEGSGTTASGPGSHAEGWETTASGQYSHVEGYETTASGYYSHAEGEHTTANHRSQHVFGEYNVLDTSTNTSASRGNYVEIVGKGTGNSTRSNARTLDWNGNEVLAGKLTVGTAPTANMDVATKKYVDDATSSHTHGNITNGGDITTNVTIASGDRLVINDESASKIKNSSITFGTNTTQYLANNGTWQSAPVTSVNGNVGAVTGLQTTSNLVTSVSSASTNAQYPSAKLFYDTVGNIETLLASI